MSSAEDLIPLAAWQDPARDMRPVARWWWPGGSVDPQGLERQLQQIKDAWDAQEELPGMPPPEYAYQMCECLL